MTGNTEVYDVMVIGSGFAGMAATLFAARRGLSVVQTGATGGIDFSTGFIDLMGVHPIAEGRRWSDPWQAITAAIKDHPHHPYALMSRAEIFDAIEEFTDFMADYGLEYVGRDDRNTCIMTPAGTVKRTYRIHKTAWNGAVALAAKAPTLIVDFQGLKGFSGRQLVENRQKDWPGLRSVRLSFPGSGGELFPEHMAWALADRKNREQLAKAVQPHLEQSEFVGFPAVLGLTNPAEVAAHLEALLGVKVFEVPTMPPSIAGPRLRSVFDRGLPNLGVKTRSQKIVTAVRMNGDEIMEFDVGKGGGMNTVAARAAILASGRFFGKGLRADRTGVREPVFGIPVHQPEKREDWHRKEFFDAKGHPVNMAGIEVDARLRPLGENGEPFNAKLHAAGAILAHHDWMRMKCGAGLAIATAYKAVRELIG